jgi:putative ABC transport system permease protein
MSFFNRVAWRPRVEDEVDEELAFHVEMRTRDNIARGMDAAAARREAERRLGDLQRMTTTLRALGTGRNQHMERTQYLSELAHDLRFTIRQLRKNPGFTAVAVLTLALGIGGTTAIFSALYAVVLQPIAIREPDRLLLVGETFQGQISSMSVGIYIDAVAGTQAFEGLAAERFSNVNLSDDVTPERVSAGYVTANFFSVMGASPAIGRSFTTDEDQPGNNRVIVLSHRLWVRRFGANPSVVNRPIRMNGVNYTVTGVMPASFDLTIDGEELWMPIAFTPAQKALHDEHYLTVYGRLKPGVSSERARAELEAVAVRVRHDFPKDAKNLVYGTRPFRDQFVGDYRARLIVLMAAVGIVLLIACGNVANLLLARGAGRAREIALRAALGAGRWRIVRQLLTESVVLALTAAGAGLVLAKWLIAAVIAWSPGGVPRLDQAHLSPVALGFAAAIALFSSVLSGLAPSLRLARTDVQTGLRDGGRGSTGGGLRDRLRAGLIVAEVALSLLLLFGAGLFIRSAVALQHVDPGFDPAGVLTARFSLPETVYGDIAREKAVLRRINDAAAQLPRISSSAVTSFAAMGGGGGSNGLIAEENGTLDPQRFIISTLRLTTPGFFSAMRTPIVKGRAFIETDRGGGQKVMIISEALAVRAFPGQDPIGKRIAKMRGTGSGRFTS